MTCEVTTLAAGESTTCTAVAPRTVTAADGAAGGVGNTATASGTARCTIPMPGGEGDRGERIVRGDDLGSGSFTALVGRAAQAALADPTTDAALAAAVVGPCPGPITSEADTVWTPVLVDGGLSLVKTGVWQDTDRDGYASTGDAVAWSIVVTNTGRTEVADVRVEDPGAGAVTCSTTTLAPRASVTCTVSTTLTAADVTAAAVSNTATAFGTTPAGDVQSPGGTGTVQLDPRPAPGPSAPPAGPALPGTGADTTAPLIAALIAVLTGAGLLVGARRRRRGTPRP